MLLIVKLIERKKKKRKVSLATVGIEPKGRGFDSHCGQANFLACPVWMQTQSNIINIMILIHLST